MLPWLLLVRFLCRIVLVILSFSCFQNTNVINRQIGCGNCYIIKLLSIGMGGHLMCVVVVQIVSSV